MFVMDAKKNMNMKKYNKEDTPATLSIFVVDTIVVTDAPVFVFFVLDIEFFEDKFVDEMALALVTIARHIYQQEVAYKINRNDIIQNNHG